MPKVLCTAYPHDDPSALPPPALALIEFSSIAAGTRATDALIKRAPIAIERLGSLQPGLFAVLFAGDVASVQESFEEGLRVGGEAVSDRVLLAHVDPTVRAAVLGEVGAWEGDTLGILETSSLSAIVQAADIAVKGAELRVIEVRLGDGLGGKGLAHFAGALHDVQAGLELAVGRVSDGRRQVLSSITPRLDEALRQALAGSTRFGEGRGRADAAG